ncbi:Mur ligase [Cyathus striatus]|nr:Mur ligase [Cyathus striatus]
MATRSYADAIEKLNSLQSNAATLDAVKASGGRLSAFAIPEMLEYLSRIGYSPEELNRLNVIHITGTKGKGSTSAFADSIIRHAMPQWKVGLYTSPHLVAVRERIRINGISISEEDFAQFFFEVWAKLEKNTKRELESTSIMPGYFRFLTLLAFHTFMKLGVDATVLEVGVGGTYDSTNIVPKPVVTGVTALGIDHISVLGRTLPEIAWQKGGIYKEGVPAFSVEQPIEGIEVLHQRAKELKASEFTIALPTPGISSIRLGLAGTHQQQNANLAVHLVRSFLRQRGHLQDISPLPPPFIRGLENAKWPGRCQTVSDSKRSFLTWYLDGAHTTESLECCVEWFVSPGIGLSSVPQSSERATRILIFNCTSGRSGQSFLETIYNKTEKLLAAYRSFSSDTAVSFFDHIIFCSNVTYADGHFKGDLTAKAISLTDLTELKTQKQLAEAWLSVVPDFPANDIHVLPSIEHAVRFIDGLKAHPAKVLVTGSLHLVGGVIEVAGISDRAL